MTATNRAAPGPATATARSRLRSVALPTEHGGWSLTAEPIMLGLVVAWSWPGLALGGAAMLGFVARTPLKLVLVDRWRHRWLDRTRLAAKVAAIELALIAVLAVLAATGAAGLFWVPLAMAVPLVMVELWFDMRSRSRRLVPELSGAIGIGSVAAAIALAGEAGPGLAAGLWSVAAARSVSAIPFVRTQLARGRRRPVRRWPSDLAQLLAVTAVAVAWAAGVLAPAPVAAMAAVSAINLAAIRLPPRPAVQIGLLQTGFGFAVVAITAASVLVG